MGKFNIFEFKFGKEKRDIFYYAKAGAVLKGSLDLLSLIPFVNRRKLFNFIDEIQLHFGIDLLNDYIIKDSELLQYRIDRVVDKTIKEYEK